MADVAITPQYRLILRRWQDGRVTIREVELFVKTNWLTREQADAIYLLPRPITPVTQNDPFTEERLEEIKRQVTTS